MSLTKNESSTHEDRIPMWTLVVLAFTLLILLVATMVATFG
jgi:hypothetical protein